MLTLILMAGSIYDSQNFEQILFKMAWSKDIFFIPELFLTKYFRIISCYKFLYVKNAVLGNFLQYQKVRASICLWWYFCVFQQAGSLYDSHATNRSAAGEEGSHRESSLLPFGHQRVIYDSHPHFYAPFYGHPN